MRVAAPPGSGSAASSAPSPAKPEQQAPLTPRQRRLAQQRRKWEESQQQQQQPSAPSTSAPAASAPAPAAARQRPQPRAAGPAAPAAGTVAAAAAAPATGARPAAAKSSRAQQPLTSTASGASAKPTAAAAAARSRDARSSSGGVASSGTSTSTSGGANKREGSGRKAPTATTAARGAPAGLLSSDGAPAPAAASATRTSATPATSTSSGAFMSIPAAGTNWPSLFTGCRGGAAASQQQQQQQPAVAAAPSSTEAGGVLPPPLGDLASLSAAELVELAKHWTQELVDWQRRQGHRGFSQHAGAPAAGGGGGAEGPAGGLLEGGSAAVGVSLPALQAQGLPPLAAARLAQLTAAVDTLVCAPGHAGAAAAAAPVLTQQQQADLVWAVGHYDWGHCVAALAPRMAVPFTVVPQFMPGLRLEDFMAEVRLNRDTIYLEDGSKAVEESRLTGWQSDIGATFKYSGKEMIPDPSGMTPAVRQVRDELQRLTGVWYDSVLINYYGDGKCGMRYHVDPLYGVWSPESAVVSIGDTRTFIFREITDYDSRWQYRVRNGDVVRMWGDCQDRLQHCVRVERAAEDAGPRMSLVFKERLRGPDGGYLQG
ncbi:hypothetical protein HYH02_000624 [Chlamydomonas schloesseri]|uniref:Fe2OG dioxygenase domain-containing protein n=1 Tax=Chlamydomonas schloesseri TaxID=2026947 RepID=A0A835WWM2_9CHLO|nr:hypothetical protein HYH02_000624 [Chlamydomonas schloesseri]|eukprot:KAG2454789.1 hypothetical protein HYH02_000624 [Chlamydomonas schloesseri]